MIIIVVILILALLIGLWLMATYNSLVHLRNIKDEGWSGIDVQLKRRFDLIPNLIEAVKGYASHEQETLNNITKARNSIMEAGNNPKARIEAENQLTGTLRSLFAVAENYPVLKANENYLQLQEQLASVEDEIQMARRYYNGTVRNLNTTIQSFPSNIVAGQFGFIKAPFFEADAEDKSNPEVKL